jgi:hypothetical protein
MSESVPKIGDVVRTRTRHWVVQEATPHPQGTTVLLACADDDAQGDELEVLWDKELDASILSEENWKDIGNQGFDEHRCSLPILWTS